MLTLGDDCLFVMNKRRFLPLITVLTLLAVPQNGAAQYYKDIFVDSGIHLSDYDDFPVARMLGLSWERFTAGEYPDHLSLRDTVTQRSLYEGSPIDENGIWLYPAVKRSQLRPSIRATGKSS